MIQLIRPDLPVEVAAELNKRQENINMQPDYTAKIIRAKTGFRSANRKGNSDFDCIKTLRLNMCQGGKRCHYCEDSAPDEIEHFKPKDLYPDDCFVWANYLYACGICNSTYKNNRFSIITPSGEMVDVTRQRGQPVTPPIAGKPSLIDPGCENPLDFIELDLFTFMLIEASDHGSEDFERARYTIEILGLNRDILVEGRRSAFDSFFARLRAYTNAKTNGTSTSRLNKIRQGFYTTPHITIWAEMKRQRHYHRKLQDMFERSHELLD